MKFKFLTVLHAMEIDCRLYKGIRLYPGTRVTNALEPISDIIDNQPFISTAGIHSINEFKDAVYLYKFGDLQDFNTKAEVDEIGNMYAFYFLREAEQFLYHLWEIKDNGVYVRDGFLVVYESNIEEGWTYKASLTTIYSDASCSKKDSRFSKDEVNLAIKNFTPFSLNEMKKDNFGGKYVDSDHFFKNSDYTRMDRALYFTCAARGNATLPMKIVSYCTALECLFTTSNSEVNHRIAERVAVLIGTLESEKKEVYSLIKKAYDYRSKIVHGSYIKGKDEDLISVSTSLDNILRKLLLNNYEVFSKRDDEIDQFFLNLLFN